MKARWYPLKITVTITLCFLVNVFASSQDLVLGTITGNTNENGSTASFTVSLSEANTSSSVVVMITSSNTAEITVENNRITFENGSVEPQTVTLIGVDDNVIDGDQDVIIQVSSDTGDTDNLTVTNVDDDEATLSVTVLNDAEEAGGNGSFTIRSSTVSTTDTDIQVSLDGTASEGEDFSTPGTVTLPANNEEVIVTIAIINDNIVEPDETITLTVNGSSNPGITPGNNNSAALSISDDDQATISIATGGNINEDGTAGLFTISSTNLISEDVELSVSITGSADNGSDYNNIGNSITLAADQTSTDLPLTPVDDNTVEPDETVSLSISYGGNLNIIIGTGDATLEIIDDDTSTLSLASTTQAAEDAGDGLLTLTASNPVNTDLAVQFTISGNATAGTDYNTITSPFTLPANTTTLDIAVEVISDDYVEGDESLTLTLTSSDHEPAVIIGNANEATVTISDNDIAGLAVTPESLNLAEGGSATLSLALSARPLTPVTVNLSNSNTEKASLSPAALTFNSNNWDNPQESSVSGLQDEDIQDESLTISVSVDNAASDPLFNNISQNITTLVVDDDSGSFSASPSALTLVEGETGSFTIALSTRPGQDVRINITSSDVSIATVNPASVSFSSDTWNTPQDVTVTAVEDNDTTDETVNLTLRVDPDSDEDFTSAANQTLTINVSDDDTAPIFTSTPPASVSEDEVYTYNITTQGTEGSTTTITAPQLPEWLNLTANTNGTAVLSGTPTQDHIANSPYAVVLRASNTYGFTEQSFSVTVNNINDSPVFTSTPVTTATQGSPYSYAIRVNDADGDDLLISVPTLPGWLTFNRISNGQATLAGTPSNANVGDNQVSITASDGESSINQNFVITVDNINDVPVITSTHITTAREDDLYQYTIIASDADGDPISIQSSSLPNWLTLVDNSDGTALLSGTPRDADIRLTPIIIQVSDGSMTEYYGFEISISNVNDNPVIDNASYTTAQNTSLSIKITDIAHDDDDLIPNEPDDNLNIQSLRVENRPDHGDVDINRQDSLIIYTPDNRFSGTDEFSLTIRDVNRARSNRGVITITVSNEAPNAVNDQFTLDEDTPATLDVLANDVDNQNNILTGSLEVTAEPNHGTAEVLNNGTILYTPEPNFYGNDQLIYRIEDADGYEDQATVSITVSSVNDAPELMDDNVSTPEDTPVTINVLANDSDIDNAIDGSTLTVIDQVTHGALVLNSSNHRFTYTPLSDFNGTDTFTYAVQDEEGAQGQATVTIRVQAVNDNPTAQDDEGQTGEDTALIIRVLNNDSDPENNIDSCSVSVVSQPGHGSASIIGCGRISYTPATDFKGTDSFSYEVCDSLGACSTASVTVTVTDVNEAPHLTDDSYTTAEDTPILLDVLANDSDEEGSLDISSFAIETAPLNGTATIDEGQVLYTPDTDFNGTDSFSYSICDNTGLCSTAAVSIEITPVNDAPQAEDDYASGLLNEVISIDVAANDHDPENNLDLNSISIISPPAHGNAVINNRTGLIQYTPDLAYEGNDQFSYSICDEEGECTEANVYLTIAASDHMPLTASDYIETNEDTPVTIHPLSNDSDPNDNLDPASLTVVMEPVHGTYSLNTQTSTIEYTPDPDYYGQDILTYQICDSGTPSFCALDTIYITVNPVNDAPVANDDFMTVMEGRSATLDLTLNDYDVENAGLLSVTLPNQSTGYKGKARILEDGRTLEYTAGYDCGCIEEVVEYLLHDDAEGSSTGIVTITIESAPDNMPEVFTPNGDGINDYFIVPGIENGELTENELLIFNRWGAQLYHMVNYDNTWDGRSSSGTLGGDELPEGTYFYVFKLKDGKVFKGTVYIKR